MAETKLNRLIFFPTRLFWDNLWPVPGKLSILVKHHNQSSFFFLLYKSGQKVE